MPPPPPSRGAQIAVLALLGLFFVTVAGFSWGRWGHVRIDAGGAIYRAAQIAEGATLYQDVQVHYPPVAPYTVGALFAVAGTHLNTVYALGLAMALLEAALLWSVARRFLSFPETAAGTAGFLGLLAFQPFLFNWIVPNVFASTFGVLFATATVALLAADADRPRSSYILLASITAALAGLSKLEHGLAAVFVLTTYVVLLQRTDAPLLRRLAAAWLPGAGVTALILLLVASSVPLEVAIFDNVYRERSFQGTLAAYTEKLFPTRADVVAGALTTYAILAARALVAAAGFALCRRGPLGAVAGLALVALGVAFPLLPIPQPALSQDLRINLLQQTQFGWAPIAWLVAIGWSVWRARTDDGAAPRVVILVGLFSIASTLRWSFNVAWPAYYAVFAPFLAVLVVRAAVLPFARERGVWAVALVMAAFAVQGTYFRYENRYTPTKFALEYPRGTIRTLPLEGAPMKKVIDYLRAHTNPGDAVAVLPEEQMINFLAETRHPTRDTGIGPGWLATKADEDRFLGEVEEAGTRFIVLSKRRYPEFQSGGVEDYNPRIVAYIRRHYEPVLSAGIYEIYRLRRS